MHNGLKTLVLTAAMASGFAAPALADSHGHWHGQGYGHSHSHSTFVFYSGPAYAPAYYNPYPPYYEPYPVAVQAPPPAYYAPPQPQPQPQPQPVADNGYCREYQSPVVVGGVRRMTYGTACMQPDGSWQIMN